MWTISHALSPRASTPQTIWLRRSKTKYCPDAARSKPNGSRNRPATCAGIASTDWSTSGPIANITSDATSQDLGTSVADGVSDGLQNVLRLRKDRFLELRRVGDRTVERADAADGGVEILEQLAGNPRGDFGAEAARQLILVRDDHAVDLLDERGDRFPVVRRDGAQVEHGRRDAVFLG